MRNENLIKVKTFLVFFSFQSYPIVANFVYDPAIRLYRFLTRSETFLAIVFEPKEILCYQKETVNNAEHHHQQLEHFHHHEQQQYQQQQQEQQQQQKQYRKRLI